MGHRRVVYTPPHAVRTIRFNALKKKKINIMYIEVITHFRVLCQRDTRV